MNVTLGALASVPANRPAPVSKEPASQPVAQPEQRIPESPSQGGPAGTPDLQLEAALDIRIRLTISGERDGHPRFKVIKKAVERFGKLFREQLEREAERLGLDEDGRKALKSLGRHIAKTLERAVKAAFRGEEHEGEVEHDGDADDVKLARALDRAQRALTEAAARIAADRPAAVDQGATVQQPEPTAAADATATVEPPATADVPAAPVPADGSQVAPDVTEVSSASPADAAAKPAAAPPFEIDPFARIAELLGRFLEQVANLLRPAGEAAPAVPAAPSAAPDAAATQPAPTEGGFTRIDVAVAFYAHVSITTAEPPAGAELNQAV